MMLNLKHSLKRSPHDFLFSIFGADPETPIGKALGEKSLNIRAKMETLSITLECDVSSGKPVLKVLEGGVFNTTNEYWKKCRFIVLAEKEAFRNDTYA